ncbi:baseplate wedge subunit [Halorubrum virus Serpecor1]|uniref:Baseplate J family protein n=1 Tax=Halorubrum virus Serpecor1 TaxID=2721757 RepID=A0A6G9RY14_9CAUD|nr:baseplate wedge subunit [Halorubrum virus Serpecor1]QIR31196.1 baseplate J family protein [Halorubrum virus Serpecor1]
MTINEDGSFDGDSEEEILDAMIADAKQFWSEDIKESDLAVIRQFYRPIARRLAQAQNDIGLVLSSTQIDNAEGSALGLLTALIGVTRQPAARARGEVTFYREDVAEMDYHVPAGTEVQTRSDPPIEYVTTEGTVIAEGTTSTTAPIVAVEPGANANVGANSITALPVPLAGINRVTNEQETTGGENRESDENLRERAKEELAEGSSATGPALVSAVRGVEGVSSVSILINDKKEHNGRGHNLPANSGELVVTGGEDADIAQAILETKGMDSTLVAGVNGVAVTGTLAELPNGQTHPIDFSRANPVTIYIEADVQVDSTYEDDTEVLNNIIKYVGGKDMDGFEKDGELGVTDDVLHGEIEYRIREIPGVYDVTSLKIGRTDPPTETTNISIGGMEEAHTDAQTDITLNVSEV